MHLKKSCANVVILFYTLMCFFCQTTTNVTLAHPRAVAMSVTPARVRRVRTPRQAPTRVSAPPAMATVATSAKASIKDCGIYDICVWRFPRLQNPWIDDD